MARYLGAAFVASSILHGVAFASLGFGPHERRSNLPATSVVFEVREAPPFETKPEPPKPREPDEPKAVPRRVAAAPASPPPEPAPARAPVDLSGVTLTNGDGLGGFAMPSGDGSERNGPLGPVGTPAPRPVPTPAAIEPRRAAPPAPELVSSRDLSERPEPPALDAALRALYPDEARRRSISGSAALRVRIDADGRVRAASVLTESFSGFGTACQKAVLGSRWSAPRDRDGRAVPTEVRYTCSFVVD